MKYVINLIWINLLFSITGTLYNLCSTLLQGDLSLRWAGWSDALAGIKLYEMAVYKMKAFGYKLTHNGETPLVRETLNATTQVYNTTIVDPGKYVFNIVNLDRGLCFACMVK